MKRPGRILLGGLVGAIVLGLYLPGAGFAGFLLGVFVMWARDSSSSSGSQTKPAWHGEWKIVAFVRDASQRGVIDSETAARLLDFQARAPDASKGPADRDVSAPHQEVGAVTAPATGAPTSPPDARKPARHSAPKATRPNPFAVLARRLVKATASGWRSFSADVAIHTVIYLGVFLLALAMFVFFGLGFYGDIVAGEAWRPWRPLVIAGVPAVLFVIAWLLRVRTGIRFTADAVGLIAALSLPIMLASLFQDGAPWGPPDLDGPARWFGYAAVGAVSAAVYLMASRRSSVYASLVAPAVWVAIGALGLFLEDGIPMLLDGEALALSAFTSDGVSWAQMVAVLISVAATVGLIRIVGASGGIARVSVRAAAAAGPLLAIIAVGLALIESQQPLDPTYAASSVSFGLGLLGFAFLGRHIGWDGLPEGLRRWLDRIAEWIAFLGPGVGGFATALAGAPAAWAGLGVAVYFALALLLARRLEDAHPALELVLWVGLLLGLGFTTLDGLASAIGWGMAAIVLVTNTFNGAWLAPLVGPVSANPWPRGGVILATSGLGMAGAARAASDQWMATAVLAWGLGVSAVKFLDRERSALSIASMGGVLVAAGGAGLAAYAHGGLGAYSVEVLGLHLLGAGLVVSVTDAPWPVRIPLMTGTIGLGTALMLRATGLEPSVIDASTAAAGGIVLLWVGRRIGALASPAAGLSGHVLVVMSPAVGARSDTGLLIGLAVASIVGFALMYLDENAPGPGLLGMNPSRLAVAHAVMANLALPVAAVLISQRNPWMVAEPTRGALVFVALSWTVTAIGSTNRLDALKGFHRGIATVLGVLAVAAAVPSSAIALISLWSLAVLLALQAVTLRSPVRALPVWIVATIAVAVTAGWAGVGRGDLHKVGFAGASALVLGGALAYRSDRLRLWAVSPLMLGLVLLPGTMAFVIADGKGVAWYAGFAALLYAAAGGILRAGAFVGPLVFMAGIAYADAIPGGLAPFTQPRMWLPLAAAVFTVALFSPQRVRPHWLSPVTPYLVTATAVILGIASVTAIRHGGVDQLLLAAAAFSATGGFRWRSKPAIVGGAFLVIASGVVAGDGWLFAALVFIAIATGAVATVRPASADASVTAFAAVGSAALAVVALGHWLAWSFAEALLAAGLGFVLATVVGLILLLLPDLPRVRVWRLPVGSLAAGGGISHLLIALDGFGQTRDALGPLAVVLLTVGTAFAVVASAQSNRATTFVAATWLAGGGVALVHWMALDDVALIAVPAVIAGVLAAVSVWLVHCPPSSRRFIWWPATAGLAQASAFLVVMGSADAFPASAALIAAGTLATEAVVVALFGRRFPAVAEIPVVAAVSAAAAVLLVIGGSPDALVTTFAVGAALLGAALLYIGVVLGRERRWGDAMVIGGAWVTLFLPFHAAAKPALGRAADVAILGIGGAGIVVAAIAARSWRASYVGIAEWVAAVVVAWGARDIPDPNFVVVPAALVILGVISLERLRSRVLNVPLGEGSDALLTLLEAAAVSAALVAAGWLAYQQSSARHLILLLAEGVGLGVWSLRTRVKRRLLLAALAVVAAAVFPVVSMITRVTAGDISGGAALGLLTGVAVGLIVLGSLLERGRARVGRALRRLSDALETWT